MSYPQGYVVEVSDALREGQVAFMVGAGISVDRQSHLPKWEDLVYQLLLIIGKHERTIVDYIQQHHMGLLFNEVILQKMVEAIGIDQTAACIKACMETDAYSAIHKFLVWSITQFGNVVLTTNYDELIERAGGSELSLLKLHGTLRDLKKARFTIRQIYSPLDTNYVTKAKEMLNERILVVAGYRGADRFDVIPLLFKEATPKRILWLVHGNIDENIDQRTRKYLEEAHWPCFMADADEFFKFVYDQTKQYAARNTELDAWKPHHSGNQPNWWVERLKSWGEKLQQEYSIDVRYLWARILDYLRIYSFKLENNRVRKPAEEQYVALQGSLDPIRSLEAQAHVAYIRRTVGDVPLKNLFVDFQKVIRGIWMMLDENQDEAQRRTLQQLLGWTIHQYGVVLQNAGAHIAAESTLQKAVEIRRLLGDAEIAHSVFLRFMNGVQAFKNGVGEVDDFAPRGWRLWLVRFLEKNSDSFRYAHDPENHGNTIHNVAFVHQFLAEEHERNMRFNEAYTEFCQALKLYEEAKDIRQDLRDPRMIAQSNVRIAQCKLWLACHERRNGNYDKARQLVEDADQLAREVSELYDRMPQESFRLDDVKEIQKKAERLRQEHLKK